MSNPAPWPPQHDSAPWPPQNDPAAWHAQQAPPPQAPPPVDPLDTSTPWPAQQHAPMPQAQMPQGDPMERTITYGQAYPAPAPPADQPPPPPEPPHRPGSNLSRDPSDPDRPFVTAGQVSGSRTPPPERQQELWNTVFGDEYQNLGDQDHDDEPSKPVWIYALAGSVAIALIVGLVWAFWAGPLAGTDPPKESSLGPAGTSASAKPTAAPTKKSTTIPRLPKFPGQASAVIGTMADPSADISIPRLGGKWQLDQRGTMIRSTYGFATRQFVKTGVDATGNPVSAHVMTGPLGPSLSKYYTAPDNLEPVIKAVVVNARKKLFPEGNTVKKIAQQALKADGLPAKLIAYELTAGEAKTTIVVAAISTGGDVPAIVYMSVPGTSKSLMPDINTVFKQIKVTQG